MPIETYTKNPALRPTILARDVLKNVYRASGPVREQTDEQGNEQDSRENNRAA